MRVAFGTIFLNEAKFIGACIKQHLWACDKWVLVEGADSLYPRDRVTPSGLSIDGSSEIVEALGDERVTLVRHGWANSKQELRNRYAELVDGYDVLVVVDADEFLSQAHLSELLCMLESCAGAVRLPHVHMWKDMRHIVTGGYWDVPHDRAYRWVNGARYVRDHNHPELRGRLIRDRGTIVRDRSLVALPDGSRAHDGPFWMHVANVKDPSDVADKNAYYVARGEERTRPETTRSRAAFFSEKLPAGLVVHEWSGSLPEELRAYAT